MSFFGEQFLTHPGSFPAAFDGKQWARESVTIRLAGECYRIGGLSPEQRDALEGHFCERSAAAPDVHVILRKVPASVFREIDTRGWEYVIDQRVDEGGITIAGMKLMARIDSSRSNVSIWTCVAGGDEFPGVVENVLRPLVAFRLLGRGGLLVHSAAVGVDGGGFLFAGKSGAGKSTISLLARSAGFARLSDDLNAVVREGEDFVLHPLPFTGDMARSEVSTEPVMLRVVASLEKGEDERIRPMRSAQAVSLLVGAAPFVNAQASMVDEVLQRAAEIASRTRTVTLTFRRDADVSLILRSLQ